MTIRGSLRRLQPVFVLALFIAHETGCVQDVKLPTDRIDPAGIRGALVIGGGGTLPREARLEFLKLAGDEAAKIVVIPTARADSEIPQRAELNQQWGDRQPASSVQLHTRSRDIANSAAFIQPLREATAVWFDDGQPGRIAEAYSGTAVEREVLAVMQRGGVVGATDIMVCRAMTAKNDLVTGIENICDAYIEPHFSTRKHRSRLAEALIRHPNRFGLGIDEDTAVIIRGRNIDVLGAGSLTISLAKSTIRPPREILFKAGEQTDLTRWRRAARARQAPPFPAAQAPEPKVVAGSLVIVGGGGLTPEIIKRFIDLAGGPESTIVVLPTASVAPWNVADQDGHFLERAGCRRVVTLTESTFDQVSSPQFLATIKTARGIWFGGGRQWRFVDAYSETPAVEAFRDVLRRGGVIGGSSAGATIQGDYLVRGSPQGNEEMLAEGYEQGFAFLPGVAIDQHFTQRNRHGDLKSVLVAFPQLLGIGLDETTAIVVTGSTADVLGDNLAHFYNARRPTADGQPECISLKAGTRYDLASRRTLSSAQP